MVKIYYYAVDKDGQGWYYDNPPIWDGESWNVDPKYDSWDQVNDLHSKSSFSFPELNKGECVEMELICELKVKTEKCE